MADIVANNDQTRVQKIHELRRKLADLETKIAAIETLDNAIFTQTDPSDLEEEMDGADNTNQILRDARDNFEFQLAAFQSEEDAATAALAPQLPLVPVAPTPSASALPKFDLPVFKGDILLWSSFWDVFEAEVDAKSYSGATKFNFLISKLEGEAKAALLGLTSSNDNYVKAKDLLRERYSQPKKVVTAHFKALINLPVAASTRSSLRSFADQLESHIRGLEALGTTPNSYGDLLVCLLIDKLSCDVRRNLTRHQGNSEWSLDELRAAIRREIDIMSDSYDQLTPNRPTKQVLFASSHPVKKKLCPYCSGEHYPTQCSEVRGPEERAKVAKVKKLCLNCLHAGHTNIKDCPSRYRCQRCQQPHHTSLHLDKNTSTNFLAKPSSTHTGCLLNKIHSKIVAAIKTSSMPFVFLKTAVATVCSHSKSQLANLLIDDGSQLTFITTRLANILRLHPIRRVLLSLSGFQGLSGGYLDPSYYDVVQFWLNGLNGDRVQIQAVVLETIVEPLEDPYRTILSTLPHLQDLHLAHPPTTNTPFTVDILIGADSYWSIVEDGNIHGTGPTAVSSFIGYLVSGPLPDKFLSSQNSSYHISAIQHDDVSQLWSLEVLGIVPDDESNDSAATYQSSCISYHCNRYTARLPWKTEHPVLPSNYLICQRRTRHTVHSLLKKPNMLQLYSKIIRDQLEAEFIEKVPRTLQTPKGCHYIPHFPVEKDSITTPIRIVYDCSCRTRSGASLNDCLLTGPPLQNNMLHILLRFRVHRIGFFSDIEKAFHKVQLYEADRDFVRFFWLSDDNDPESDFAIYRFKVIPFGASSSPFILNSVIKKHLQRYSSPVSTDIESNIYVDNLMSGSETTAEASIYYAESISTFQAASLSLHSWAFSDASLNNRAILDGVADASSLTKALGLLWDRTTDQLQLPHFSLPQFCTPKATKRDLLRAVASIYDPLGFISPLSIPARILIQQIWKEKLEWDDPLPSPFADKWNSLANALVNAKPKIRRSYFGTRSRVNSLHVFVDASQQAYGAVAYLLDGQDTAFVMSKARVAPLKGNTPQLTLPQLELMAAIIGTRLATTIITAFKSLNILLEIFMWSDSQIVLYWLSKADRLKNPFVSNRIATIQAFNRLHLATWNYCPTTSNPADLLTRGITLQQLQASPIWINGPSWLPSREDWPQWSVSRLNQVKILHLMDISTKTAPTRLPLTIDIAKVMDISRFNWTSLKRTTAVLFRQLYNFRQKKEKWIQGFLSTNELHQAEIKWIHSFQFRFLAAEYDYLCGDKRGRRPSLVSQLDLYIDNNSIIRCQGRLTNADLSSDAKNPILIPKNSKLSEIIIRFYHERALHSGAASTICHIRQRFWISSIRQQVKAVVRLCTTCRRVNGPPYRAPNSASLPSFRVRGDRAFAVTGIDFAGPFPIRALPGQEESKAYICLFTCTTSRAIHLELVEDLTTANFILAFRSFITHHFQPRMVLSDNATTFESAARMLKRLYESTEVVKYLSDNQIEWRFIPKRAPWYGGFWERLVGLTKEALKKMLGRTRLKFNEFRIIVAEIETILNDRPLTYVSSDLRDPQALTPSHLLYGDRLTRFPYDPATDEELLDPTFGEKPSHLLNMFSRRQRILKSFWKRWQRDYLTSLRERHIVSGKHFESSAKVGDVVLVHNEGPRIDWKLAIIEKLIVSPDGETRIAEIRTAEGKTNRPVSKLYPLEITETSEASPHYPIQTVSSDPTPSPRPPRQAALAAKERIRLLAEE
ncbi:uncharacterized protein LOC130701716 [Daphnia carinata]|uniref:uncharacterized protein LOC130701716 n=1 Tax=Daphnia carinata TaxID=120202 RepID=UPI00257C114A|nr:uncharacterized protein LOC130701716 [Daphnia carinata]